MKSIMEEASSISKAVDLAWNRAGKPAQFSVKVLEEPERNMFGLTVKSAKIALFFEERRKAESPTRQPERRRPARQEQPTRAAEQPKNQNETRPLKRPRPEWTESLAQEAKDWVDSTLKISGMDHIQYNSSFSGSAIKFIFDATLTGTEGKDRMLFSSFACLILATLRNRHKRQLRNLKVILLTA